MGREIRRIPPNWEHPRYTRKNAPNTQLIGDFHPLYDQDYDSAAKEWARACHEWHITCPKHERSYWEAHDGPPDRDYYRAEVWTPEQATHYQIYETVSEGTPVSPVFATKEELVEYLVTHGDYWDMRRGLGGWDRGAAEQFVGRGFAPSAIVVGGPTQDRVFLPRDGAPPRRGKE